MKSINEKAKSWYIEKTSGRKMNLDTIIDLFAGLKDLSGVSRDDKAKMVEYIALRLCYDLQRAGELENIITQCRLFLKVAKLFEDNITKENEDKVYLYGGLLRVIDIYEDRIEGNMATDEEVAESNKLLRRMMRAKLYQEKINALKSSPLDSSFKFAVVVKYIDMSGDSMFPDILEASGDEDLIRIAEAIRMMG